MRERGSVTEKISVCGIEKGRVGKLVYEREREREEETLWESMLEIRSVHES